MKTEDIHAAVPDDAFVYDGRMKGKVLLDNYRDSLVLQSKSVLIILSCI